MSMRRPAIRGRKPSVHFTLTDSGWTVARLATLRHASLPWHEGLATEVDLGGTPLLECRNRGSRDLLSLTGQFAAHLAFLRFAGIDDSTFDARDWQVIPRRGEDCRLIRLRAPQSAADDVSALSLAQQFVDAIDAPALEIFSQTWAKAESIYREAYSRVRSDRAADLRWLRSSAVGSVVSPGPARLQKFLQTAGSRLLYQDEALVHSLALILSSGDGRDFVVLGGDQSSLLQSYSAVLPLSRFAGPLDGRSPGDIAETIVHSMAPEGAVIAIRHTHRFDDRSRELVRVLLESGSNLRWLIPAEDAGILGKLRAEGADSTRFFVLSPRLLPAQELQESMEQIAVSERQDWIDRWTKTSSLDRFLDEGSLPEVPISRDLRAVHEPTRSYLAALALLGCTVDVDIATEFLREIGCVLPLTSLVVERISAYESGRFCFSSASVQRSLRDEIPAAARSSLSLIGARLLSDRGFLSEAADLYLQSGDAGAARRVLEHSLTGQLEWQNILRLLQIFPEPFLKSSATVSARISDALIRSGSYDRARGYAEPAEAAEREVLLASIDRRRGHYESALARLRAVPQRTFACVILEGELLRLMGEHSEARKSFVECLRLAESVEEQDHLRYEDAILSLDSGALVDEGLDLKSPYLSSRYRCYMAYERRDYEQAIEHAEAARNHARTVPEAIDAALDVVYARFMAGAWDEARHEARRALAMVEETDGDRAAGGALFTLAYLCADEGQWSDAAEKIVRLRRFYSSSHDAERLHDVDLLVAHSALTRCSFDQAETLARTLVDVPARSPLVREAAALIVDEVNWIRGQGGPLRSAGDSGCVTFTSRRLLLLARRGESVGDLDAFDGALLLWEKNGCVEPAPLSNSKSQRLRLLRSQVAAGARGATPQVRDSIRRCCEELDVIPIGISGPGEHPDVTRELHFLQLAAGQKFPYEDSIFDGEAWLCAFRNRLGKWTEFGSYPQQETNVLDALLHEPQGDWLRCGDEGLFYLRGVGAWAPESRRAIVDVVRLRRENVNLRQLVAQEEVTVADRSFDPPLGMVGSSLPFMKALRSIPQFARRDAPVLILGESGTGKELFARAFHEESDRRGRAFTAVNCAALPESLVESELFGHVRGAFTGADRDRPGLIEVTDRGTLFLDEIGELPLPSQAKLLRFLQEGEFRRVGESTTRRADVRIIAATNRKLEQAVDENKFREDLFYRICVLPVNVPSLRDRGGDIVLLARHFLKQEHQKQRGGADRLSEETELVLLSYQWPGNVRELQNAIRAAHALAGDARSIELEHLPERLRGVPVVRKLTGSYFEELVQFRRSLVERSLLQAKGNQNQAAKLLGMSRQALAYQIRELGIQVK